jgi:UDP-glucose 4-epimerase
MTVKRKILVTGGNGLLARHALLNWKNSYELHATVHAQPRQPIAGVQYHDINFATQWDDSYLPEKVDAVIHLAQSSNMRGFPEAASDIYAVNTQSTARLLDYAVRAGAQSFVFTSTGGLYAPSIEGLTEGSKIDPPRGPLGYYFDTKRCSEILVQAYSEHMQTVILRPFFIYGPGQRDSMFIPRLIENIRAGKPVTVCGGVGAWLNPVHASDGAKVLAACLNKDTPAVLNLAGTDITTIREIAEHIGQALGKSPIFSDEPGEADIIVADTTLLQSRMQDPMMDMTEGLRSCLGAIV